MSVSRVRGTQSRRPAPTLLKSWQGPEPAVIAEPLAEGLPYDDRGFTSLGLRSGRRRRIAPLDWSGAENDH